MVGAFDKMLEKNKELELQIDEDIVMKDLLVSALMREVQAGGEGGGGAGGAGGGEEKDAEINASPGAKSMANVAQFTSTLRAAG